MIESKLTKILKLGFLLKFNLLWKIGMGFYLIRFILQKTSHKKSGISRFLNRPR
jgi:hypothetical protein